MSNSQTKHPVERSFLPEACTGGERRVSSWHPLLATVLIIAAVVPIAAAGMSEGGRHAHRASTASGDQSLAEQLVELRAQVARLEGALERGHRASPAGASGESRMETGMTGEMVKGGMHGGGMEGMSGAGGGMTGRGMRKQMMGTPPENALAQSSLPGFPGASHVYHIGATGFFLDHPDHVDLGPEQRARLARIREGALLTVATTDRRIEEAEQDLWVLTAADRPDSEKIEAQVRKIEKLCADRRLSFLRAVGEAAEVLTEEQRSRLSGAAGARE